MTRLVLSQPASDKNSKSGGGGGDFVSVVRSRDMLMSQMFKKDKNLKILDLKFLVRSDLSGRKSFI